jgi:hypothetical protein
MIDTRKNRKNLYMELDNLALVRKLRPLLERGGYILRPSDSKFIPKITSMAWDSPWVYVKSVPQARCDLYHRVFFNILRHVHSYCRSCWKVVVRPRNLVELFDLLDFQFKMCVPCKCGIERRQTVNGLYGGYFYTRSKEEGLERYKEVRELVNQYLSPETPVILKRYCTEFELGDGHGIEGFGPSDQMPDVTPEERAMEKYIESNFPSIGCNNPQPDHLIASTMMSWIDYAFKHGDQTYSEFTNGSKLVKDYITYHNTKE